MCLLLSCTNLAFLAPPVLGIQPVQVKDDRGTRYHLCFTATDSYNQSTTACNYITVVGACTPATADINIDGQVDILDASILALHFGENRTGPQPYNMLDTPVIGVEDASCMALMFDQTDPLPA